MHRSPLKGSLGVVVTAKAEGQGMGHPMSSVGWVEVHQDRTWFGTDPGLATFIVYVDRHRVGKVPLRSSLRIPLSTGRHQMRIRQWWYLSKPTQIDVCSGQVLQFRADIPRTRIVRMLFVPTRCLELIAEQPPESPGSRKELGSSPLDLSLTTPSTNAQGHRAYLQGQFAIGALLQFVGFLVLVFGIRKSWMLIVLGTVLIIVGISVGIRLATLGHGKDRHFGRPAE